MKPNEHSELVKKTDVKVVAAVNAITFENSHIVAQLLIHNDVGIAIALIRELRHQIKSEDR